MIDGLKPYAEYKESGLPWLDAVPEHWEMVPNRALMTDQRQVVGENAADYMLLSLTLRGIIPRNMENPKGKFPAQFNTYKVVRPDDIVFCLFDIDETPRGVGLSNLKGMITGAYDVFSPRRGINPGFLSHYYLFVDEGKLMKPLYTGLRKTIQRGVFASLKAPCPPSEEQAAIVRFLDHANRKIDRFIRAKRKLIELLGEQKQAIIQRAVTRGLNPNVTLKASGIPWLGEIPEHWEVRKLKQCVTAIEQGWSPQCDANRASESEWGVLKVGCVNKDSFAPEQNKKLPKNLMPDPSLEILDGDILVSRANTRELLGLAAIAEMPRPKLILCDKLFRFRVRPQFFNSKFLVSALRSKPSRVQIESSTNGASSSMQNIGQGVLKKLWVSIPTIAEQERIVDYIASECEPLSTAVTRTELEIALIQEYRTRLTADIVTGKLDVREAAAKLPDLPTDTDCSSDAKTQDEELFEEPESGEE